MLCAINWPHTKLGLLVDAALIVLAILAGRSGGSYVEARFVRELSAAASTQPAAAEGVIDERAVSSLPEPVRRYLQSMGAVDRRRDWSVRAGFDARFRRLDGDWQTCKALQYDTRLPITRQFYMQLSLKGVLPVTVRDTYSQGHGTMLAKAFALFKVAEGRGNELDVGELVTYLNDAILMAPSLLLGPETTWVEVDSRTFDVRLSDRGLRVTARVRLDGDGRPLDFSTKDRFLEGLDGKTVRTEWRTPVSGWQDVNGRKLPIRAQAVWQLSSGAFTYADFTFDPKKIAFNVPPTDGNDSAQ